jgi:hypothetical protein
MPRLSLLVSTAILVAACAPLAGCIGEGTDEGSESNKTPLASGVLTVAIGGVKRAYSIKLRDGSYVPLDVSHIKAATPGAPESGLDLASAVGTPVDVFGEKQDNGTITVDTLQRAAGQSESADAIAATGTMRVLVLNVTFDNGAAIGTNTAISNLMNTATKHFAGSSFNKVNMGYDVVGPYKVTLGGCSDADYHRWITVAQDMAVKQGKKLSNYTHFSLWGNYNCDGGSSWGQVGGGITWIHSMDASYAIHELGHNLGLNHAHAKKCKGSNGAAVPMSNSCTDIEYGDPFDTMGDASGREFNAGYKAAIGWIPAANVKSVTTSQTVTLAPASKAVNAPQVLSLKGPSGFTYQVEFRAPTATDQFPTTESDAKGVLIRAVTRTSGNGDSYLLDMNPGGNFMDAALGVGKSYTLFGTSAKITLLSISAAGAQVQVSGL